MANPKPVGVYPPRELFAARVAVDRVTGCWNWTGPIKRCEGRPGTPHVTYKNQFIRAQRWAWALHHGRDTHRPIRTACGNSLCVRPDHLVERTAPAKKCARGHPFDDTNTYITPSTGFRRCLACKRADQQKPAARARDKRYRENLTETQRERMRERARAAHSRNRTFKKVAAGISWSPSANRWLILDGDRWIKGGDAEAEMYVSRALRGIGIVGGREGHPMLWMALAWLKRQAERKAAACES